MPHNKSVSCQQASPPPPQHTGFTAASGFYLIFQFNWQKLTWLSFESLTVRIKEVSMRCCVFGSKHEAVSVAIEPLKDTQGNVATLFRQ